jgi:RHS repeat-associated protein
LYIYLSYENESQNWVYFDDLKVTYKKSQVVQSNTYYAFGMQTSESWTRTDTQPNKYLYNGGSELNNVTGNYEMFFREYDPALGRMNAIDPMASKYASLTPYNYSFNDPVTFNDPSGADPYYQDVPGYEHYPYWTGYINGQYYVTDNLPQRDRGEAVYNNMSRVYRGGDPYGIARSAHLWSTMQQMRADAYNLSAEEYGYKYGQAISMSTFFGYVASYNKASLVEIMLASIRVIGNRLIQEEGPFPPSQDMIIRFNESVNKLFGENIIKDHRNKVLDINSLVTSVEFYGDEPFYDDTEKGPEYPRIDGFRHPWSFPFNIFLVKYSISMQKSDGTYTELVNKLWPATYRKEEYMKYFEFTNSGHGAPHWLFYFETNEGKTIKIYAVFNTRERQP